MWQKFTERARRVVFFAQEEAGRLGENYVSTEHLLLGLVREDDSTAVHVLRNMGVSAQVVRAEVEKQVTRGDGRLGTDMQLTPRAKRVIDLSYDEARGMSNEFIGTEHILLGLVREAEGLAGRVLASLGVEIDATRKAAIAVQAGEAAAASAQPTAHPEAPCELQMTPTQTTSPGNLARFGESEALQSLRNMQTVAGMAGKDLVGISCLSRQEIERIFAVTRILKQEMAPQQQRKVLEGKTLAMVFEKPSLRTRVSFETGIFQLGGHGIYLAPTDISLGKRESVADVARTLDRMSDIIMARVFEHEKVTELAAHSRVPVINGLSDLEHPCQALADFYTILEKKSTLAGLKLAFIGDGNNVAHSLMLLAAKVGTSFAIGCPKGYEPDPEVLSQARGFARETGAVIEVIEDPAAAARGADAVYTDVWASMGQEEEEAERGKVFANYQVNADLMRHAKPDAIFLHCLPAHRGSEVTDEVVDSPQSVVFDEAENRLHVQKAVMALVGG